MSGGGWLESLDKWVRRGPGRFLLLVVALTVAGTAVLVAAVLAASGTIVEDSRFWDGDGPGWASVVGSVLLIAGLAWMGGGFWWLVHNGYYRRNARARQWADSRARRRQLVRQVRGTAARQDEDQPVLPLVAAHLVDQPKFLQPLCGMALSQVGQAFRLWAPGFVLVAAFVVGTLAIGAVMTFRDARRARAFLVECADGDTCTEAPAGRPQLL